MTSKKVEYLNGVDILGFPTYVRHEITRGVDTVGRFKPKKKAWYRVDVSLIKQF